MISHRTPHIARPDCIPHARLQQLALLILTKEKFVVARVALYELTIQRPVNVGHKTCVALKWNNKNLINVLSWPSYIATKFQWGICVFHGRFRQWKRIIWLYRDALVKKSGFLLMPDKKVLAKELKITSVYWILYFCLIWFIWQNRTVRI